MMNVAFGRLQLSVTLAQPSRRETRAPARPQFSDALEKAYRRDQVRRELEAEKLRSVVRYYHTPR
ncbi:MAG TPA: hypothetical protein VF898_12360 [Chloroflexota bacterium]